MGKQIMYSDEGRKKILDGIEKLTQTLKVTMGPLGRYVVYEKSYGSPGIINDGATVAKEVELEDPFENMGAQLVRQVAQKTNDKAGDGTTTATVLAESIYRAGLKSLITGVNPVAIKQGIDLAVNAVVSELESMSKACKKKEDVARVASISANDEASGQLIADALEKVGHDGVVNIEEGNTNETTLEFVEGMEFDKGYLSPYFVTNAEKMEVELEDALILFHEKKISGLRDLLPLLERVAQVGSPLLIIAEDVESEPLTALVVNRLRGTLKCAAVKAPGFGDRRKAMMQDMAIMTGGTFVSDDLGISLETLEVDKLGRCKKVIIDKDSTKLIQGAGKKKDIDARIEQVKHQIETTTSDYDREKLQERLAKLSGGVAVINVGASTETETKERKARIEDALHAARAAVEEGVLPGGGVALIRAMEKSLDKTMKKARGDMKIGVKILADALTAPLRTIADNAGEDGSVVVDTVRESKDAIGWDAVSNAYVDMFKAGIIDATKVVRIALQNAASIAALLLTTETLVTELKDKQAKAVAGAVS